MTRIAQTRCSRTRCFCCGARAPADEGAWTRCTWCDMRWPVGAARHDAWAAELRAALAGQLAPVQAAWRGTHRTWRIAASGARLWHAYAPGDGGRIVTGPAAPALGPIAGFAPLAVSLVVLSRPDDPRLRDCLRRHAPHFSQAVAVLDARAPMQVPGAEVVARPLGNDFAAQRNFATCAARGAWILHLDTDESMAPEMAALMGHLAAAAEASKLRAVGFARRNIVDGQVSDLFPDIQYRLIRRDVRFRGRVHERPLACDDGSATTVAQIGTLDHHLAGARIAARRARYDAMGQSAERHGDDLALLRPYRP